jgi:hypothetical protein
MTTTDSCIGTRKVPSPPRKSVPQAFATLKVSSSPFFPFLIRSNPLLPSITLFQGGPERRRLGNIFRLVSLTRG